MGFCAALNKFKKFKKYLSGLIIYFILSTFFISLAAAKTLYVDHQGSAQYTTIQSAVTAALSGDTVQVGPGTYDENVILKSGVILQGAGANRTVIDGGGRGKDVVKGGLNSQIIGFKIINSGMYDMKTKIPFGVDASYGRSTIIKDCLIIGNYYGVCIGEANGTIINCTIIDNLGPNPGMSAYPVDLWIFGLSAPNIKNSIIGNYYGLCNVGRMPTPTFSYNDMLGVRKAGGYNYIPGTGDIQSDPLCTDRAQANYHLSAQSPCKDTGDPNILDEDSSRSDMGVTKWVYPEIPVVVIEAGFAGAACERNPDGSIGSKLAGVTITFTSEDGSTVQHATTSGSGSYRIPLTPARYVVTADLSGYEHYSSSPGFFVCTGNGYRTGNFFLKKISQPVPEPEPPEIKDSAPPTVNMIVLPPKVVRGETARVMVYAADDLNLSALWWWGQNTGDPELDKAHWFSCSGSSAGNMWLISTENLEPGTYTFGANARDSAYPVPGVPHQASEGAGIQYAQLIIEKPLQLDQSPPTVAISVEPERVVIGESITVTVAGTDDLDLSAIWWFGVNTADVDMNKAHWYACSGTNVTHAWTIETAELSVGTYKLGANSRDKAYPTPGEPHQASEGAGIAYTSFVIKEQPDTTPPNVVIISPEHNSTVSDKAAVTAEVTDNKLVSRVECAVDGSVMQVYTSTALSYVWVWDTNVTENGLHEISVTGYDSSGNSAVQSLRVNVDNIIPGTAAASIKIPKPGKRIRGNAVTIMADISDNTRGVQFQYSLAGNAQSWIDISTRDSKKPFSVYWNVTELENNEYLIRAVAYDEYGNPDLAPTNSSVIIDDVNPDIVEDGNPDVDPNNFHRKCEKVDFKKDTEIMMADGTKVTIPADISNESETFLDITKPDPEDIKIFYPAPESSLKPVGVFRKFEFQSGLHLFDKDITLTIPYPDENNDRIVDGTDVHEKNLRIFYFNEETNEWVNSAGSAEKNNKGVKETAMLTAHNQDNTVAVQVNHFTLFALMAAAPSSDLSGVIVYPVPFEPGVNSAYSQITFDGLPQDVTIQIYSIAGRLVKEWSGNTLPNYQWCWDAKNNDNDEVVSGVYLYLITSSGKKAAKGKIAIIR
ncbi:MAG: Ig-like domain-containing protein [bacterium]